MNQSSALSTRPSTPQAQFVPSSPPSLHRRWFIRQLIPLIGGLRYAWLSLNSKSVENISDNACLDIAIASRELDEWKAISTHLPYVLNSHIESGKKATIICLEFKDRSFLQLTLVHCIGKRRDAFKNSKKMLDGAFLNEEGMKVAAMPFVLEYLSSTT